MVDSTNKANTVKKAPVKKTVATKLVVKKTPVKKVVAVKPVVKKAAVTKTVVKKTVVAKSVVKKVPVKKTVVEKSVAKKAPVKKVVASKSVVKNTPVKKTVVVKSVVKKATVKKTVPAKIASSKSSGSFIKNNFLDLSLLYKNFIHWNISKLVIFIWSIILGFISISPFVLGFFIYSMFSEASIGMLIGGMFNGTFFSNLFGILVLILMAVVYVIVFSYSNFLFIKLNNGYESGKLLPLKQNDYFDIKKIIKFLNLSFLNLFILFLPVLLFFILLGILYLFSGGYDAVSALLFTGGLNYFVVLSFSFFVISALLIVYLYYRLVFSYFVMSDDIYYEKSKSALSYVKESFSKTKKIKNFFKFIVIVLLIMIITFPIKYVGKVLEMDNKYLSDYSTFINASEEGKSYLISLDSVYYQGLEVEFNGISNDEIDSKLNITNIYMVLFTIFNFIFLYGLFVMVLGSFYKRELK